MMKFLLKLRYVLHVVLCDACSKMQKCRDRQELLRGWRRLIDPPVNVGWGGHIATTESTDFKTALINERRPQPGTNIPEGWPAPPTPELWSNPARQLIQITDAKVIYVPLGAYVATPSRYLEISRPPDDPFAGMATLGQIEINLASANTVELRDPDWVVWLMCGETPPVVLRGHRVMETGGPNDTDFRMSEDGSSVLIVKPWGEQANSASTFLRKYENTGNMKLRLYLNGHPIRGSDFPLAALLLDVDALRIEAVGHGEEWLDLASTPTRLHSTPALDTLLKTTRRKAKKRGSK